MADDMMHKCVEIIKPLVTQIASFLKKVNNALAVANEIAIRPIPNVNKLLSAGDDILNQIRDVDKTLVELQDNAMKLGKDLPNRSAQMLPMYYFCTHTDFELLRITTQIPALHDSISNLGKRIKSKFITSNKQRDTNRLLQKVDKIVDDFTGITIVINRVRTN